MNASRNKFPRLVVTVMDDKFQVEKNLVDTARHFFNDEKTLKLCNC